MGEFDLSNYPIELINHTQSLLSIPDDLVHQLAQPVTTISFYIWSCIHGLTNGTQEKEPILQAMNKAIQDIEYAQQIVMHIQDYLEIPK